MARNIPSYYQFDGTIANRSLEVPSADWQDGMNKGGSCTGGIGINTGDYDPKLSDWPLEARTGRTPQLSMYIGGNAQGDGDGLETPLKFVQGADINDNPYYVVAAQDTAPDAGLEAGGTGAINKTGKTVPEGSRVWGVEVIA